MPFLRTTFTTPEKSSGIGESPEAGSTNQILDEDHHVDHLQIRRSGWFLFSLFFEYVPTSNTRKWRHVVVDVSGV